MELLCDWTLSILLRGTLLVLLLVLAERVFRLRPGRNTLGLLLLLSFLPPGPYMVSVPEEIPLTAATVRQLPPAEPVAATVPVVAKPVRTFPVREAKQFFVLAVFAVGLFLLGKRLWQLYRWNRRVRELPPLRDLRLNGLLAEARRLCGVNREIRLSASDIGPLSCGVRHPAILLPEAKCIALDDSGLRMLLVHECRHLKRQDPLRACLLALWEALFWFHPLLPVCRRRFAELREAACDRETARLLDFSPRERARYAGLIYDFAAAGNRLPVVAASPLGPHAGVLKQRIQEITMKTVPVPFRRKLLFLLALVIGGIAAGCLTPGVSGNAEPAADDTLNPDGMTLAITVTREDSDLRCRFQLKEGENVLAAPSEKVPEGVMSTFIIGNGPDEKKIQKEYPSKNFETLNTYRTGIHAYTMARTLDAEHVDLKFSLIIRSVKEAGQPEKLLIREYHFPAMKLGETVHLNLADKTPQSKWVIVPKDPSGMTLKLIAERHESYILFHCTLSENGKIIASPKVQATENTPATVILEKGYDNLELRFPLRNFGEQTNQGLGCHFYLSGRFLDAEHADVKLSLILTSFLRHEKNGGKTIGELIREYHFPAIKLGETITLNLAKKEPGQL